MVAMSCRSDGGAIWRPFILEQSRREGMSAVRPECYRLTARGGGVGLPRFPYNVSCVRCVDDRRYVFALGMISMLSLHSNDLVECRRRFVKGLGKMGAGSCSTSSCQRFQPPPSPPPLPRARIRFAQRGLDRDTLRTCLGDEVYCIATDSSQM